MGRVKESGKTNSTKQPNGVNLQPEERLRIFANLLIDRFLEDLSKGALPDLTKSKET